MSANYLFQMKKTNKQDNKNNNKNSYVIQSTKPNVLHTERLLYMLMLYNIF